MAPDPNRLDPRDVVARKRDGDELTPAEMEEFVLGYATGRIPDYLAAAFLMAVYLRGLSREETSSLARAMVRSGSTLPLRGVSRPKVDKHSTGGVSDGVTLVFAPLAASLGLAVAKLSGRGLGHTGGTLDKLESIPGFRTDLGAAELERQVEKIGCAVAAQSKDLVPVDGALYALRDATATVASVPLIAASVMSKKLAVGTDLILLDVKAGSGAFMKTPRQAFDLAAACIALSEAWGRPARAAVTDMSQPLGRAIGNALDVAEAVRVLRGEEEGRLRDLSLTFAAEAVSLLTGRPRDEARAAAERALDKGDAAESFARMVAAQGGDARVVEDPWGVLPSAPIRVDVPAPFGYLAGVDAEALGRAAVGLGAGRVHKGDRVDPAVGVEFCATVGDRLGGDRPLAVVHGRDGSSSAIAAERVRAAILVSDEEPAPSPLIHGWLGESPREVTDGAVREP
ncbi:MAG: thymidine phosphorylase [Actinobacteria bacterium]|nr:thymidine phosphorylase [Actinomycetota bacterium]